MTELIEYRMEIVGGPFDGLRGMKWRDDGDHPLPEIILLGMCPGNGSCGASPAGACERKGAKHPYFWTATESNRPSKVTPYELSEHFIEPHAEAGIRIAPARAIYTIGGLQLPKGDDLNVERPKDRELETVGGGGGVYASGERAIETGR